MAQSIHPYQLKSADSIRRVAITILSRPGKPSLTIRVHALTEKEAVSATRSYVQRLRKQSKMPPLKHYHITFSHWHPESPHTPKETT